ncbi:type II toxin-antitoxin system RelE/ParE family toxin [Providencia stuartii]|uniref:Toxin-antitoxin system, toxin component, RelE family n=1 Tax=Providencia stuartii ATCC 25827 TaxID=471874 RepID=A0AA87CSX1_PROST|nr:MULTISPECIES: type II toxin-antitoxin system RelE/ParE family toxin [Providencia]EDU61366.1 toxin-antitoxin system, toxin component, RelE family [Providencia stuartii ATCC 25827]MBS7782191.1 type II toxin-antitoxin system RelE/ParE family toxin [Providencia thailandensis]MTC80707.1 type II toxin-antitoxin system RelE/ParE family toxin [Providencia stuartii]MTC92908.1 type II toxin-antitoxin system RelE/ParE family toxin [Providencia stuartii]
MKLGISPLAVQDLESIGDWIAKDNPIRALSFIEELYQKCLLIADSPTLYAECPEILPGLRSCAYGRYLLFFRVLEAEVRIERILHGSRDIPAHFS